MARRPPWQRGSIPELIGSSMNRELWMAEEFSLITLDMKLVSTSLNQPPLENDESSYVPLNTHAFLNSCKIRSRALERNGAP